MTATTRLAIWFAIAVCQRASNDAVELARLGKIPKREAHDRCYRCHRDLHNIADLLWELRG